MSSQVNEGINKDDLKLGIQTTDKVTENCVTVGFMDFGNVPQNTIYGIKAKETVHGIQVTDRATEDCMTVGFMTFVKVPHNTVYGLIDYGSILKHPTDEELLDLSYAVTTFE